MSERRHRLLVTFELPSFYAEDMTREALADWMKGTSMSYEDALLEEPTIVHRPGHDQRRRPHPHDALCLDDDGRDADEAKAGEEAAAGEIEGHLGVTFLPSG